VGDSEIGGKGAIEVSVTVDENGVVTDIQVTKNGDTAGIADAAVEAMPGRIMAAQSANVDGVSGATMTSEAIKMAVLDAVTAAGLDTVKWSTYVATEAAKADDATYNTDIVIVGAGGAGMTAALTAAEKGADVIILESQAAVGGNSVRATGGMNAADTPAQDENEYGVQFHQLVAVEIADRVCLIVRPLLFDFFRQLGDGHVVGPRDGRHERGGYSRAG